MHTAEEKRNCFINSFNLRGSRMLNGFLSILKWARADKKKITKYLEEMCNKLNEFSFQFKICSYLIRMHHLHHRSCHTKIIRMIQKNKKKKPISDSEVLQFISIGKWIVAQPLFGKPRNRRIAVVFSSFNFVFAAFWRIRIGQNV